MKLVALSYASSAFADYQRIWALTAGRAGFDEIRSCGADDLDTDFRSANATILAARRGAGYWLWKPYLIARTLSDIDAGDVVFYSDSAAQFVEVVDPIVSLMDRCGLDVMLLGEGFVERQFTKRDTFVLMDCDEERYAATPQRFASFIVVHNRAWTRRFVADYLGFSTDPRILTDQPNTLGLANHPDFIDHRHDQSVLSLLSKRYDVEIQPNGFIAEGLADRTGQIINHTRTHHSPSAVARHLLGTGVVGPTDIDELATTDSQVE